MILRDRIVMLVAVLVAVFMAVFVCGVRFRNVRRSWTSAHSAATVRRMSYFLAKTMLALLLVLFTGLEWSRPESAISGKSARIAAALAGEMRSGAIV